MHTYVHGLCQLLHSEHIFFFFFFLIDKFVPSVHSLQEIATRANTNPEAK